MALSVSTVATNRIDHAATQITAAKVLHQRAQLDQ
jgi:hypothetical protein